MIVIGRYERYFFLVFLCILQCHGETFRGQPLVDTQISLLDSYIPAAMQIIAHLTETMKYDLRPPSITSTTPGPSLGNQKPTSTHKPGVYAPEKPLGPENYQKSEEYQEYVQRIQSGMLETYDDVGLTKLARVETNLRVENEELPENLENLIGEGPAKLIQLINSQDLTSSAMEPEDQVQIFSKNYDDSDFRLYLEKNKRAPPTRAYVTLLSLYDQLSKDAKRQGYNKYQGYHQHILVELSKSSSGTSAEQLKFVLEKILSNQDTNQPDIKKKIDSLLEDLRTQNSYLHKALMYVPPLQFTL